MKALKIIIGLAVLASASCLAATRGIDYDSGADWKNNAVQPDGSWQYGMILSGTFSILGDQGQESTWIGGTGLHWGSQPAVGQFSVKSADDGHAVRRWTSPVSGRVEVDYELLRLGDEQSGAAVTAMVQLNGTSVWDLSLVSGGGMEAGRIDVDVALGDTLDFVLDAEGAENPGWTHFLVQIRTSQLRPNAQSGLLAHWTMDGRVDLPSGSGANRLLQAVDKSGNNSHALMQMGADSRTDGRIGNALMFDGDYASPRKTGIGSGATALTCSVWIYPLIQGDFRGIVTSDNTGYCGLNSTEYVDNGVEFRTMSGNLRSPANVIPYGAWTHVVGVWESGIKKKIFVNGVEVATASGDEITTATLDIGVWYLGTDRLISGRYFSGRIDDVSLWTRALADNEVKELYELGLNGWDAAYLGNMPDAVATKDLTYLDGLALWLDGGDVDGQNNTTLIDGDLVGQWINKAPGAAGSGYAVEGADQCGKFGSASGPNRCDALMIEESGGLKFSEFMASSNFSIFAVAKNNGGAGDRPLFRDSDSGSGKLVFGTTAAGCYVADSAGDEIRTSFSGQLFDDQWGVGTMILSGSTLLAGAVDDLQTASNAAYGATTWSGSGELPAVGAANTVSGELFTGGIAEILVYDHALTSTQRQEVIDYLNRKYFQHSGGFLLKLR